MGTVYTPPEPEVLEAAIEAQVQRRVAMALDDIPARSLSMKEVADLQSLLERERRVRWLATSIRTLLVYVAAVVAGLTVGYEALRAAIKKLVE